MLFGKRNERVNFKTIVRMISFHFRAMSSFENRDFDGLKTAMRKMPNLQATGEELGRSISCGWDMKAFDMLATVETLKGVSKRR